MASKDAEGSGTPLLEPDSCLDKTCLFESDCCLTRGCLEAGRVLPLASMVVGLGFVLVDVGHLSILDILR